MPAGANSLIAKSEYKIKTDLSPTDGEDVPLRGYLRKMSKTAQTPPFPVQREEMRALSWAYEHLTVQIQAILVQVAFST